MDRRCRDYVLRDYKHIWSTEDSTKIRNRFLAEKKEELENRKSIKLILIYEDPENIFAI